MPYSFKRALPVYLSWWAFWSLVHALLVHRLGLSWNLAFVDSLLANVLLALASLIPAFMYRFYQPGKNARIYRFVFAIVITAVFTNTFKWILEHALAGEADYLHFLEQSMPIRFVFALLILSFISLLTWMMNILQEQRDREGRRNEAEQLVKDAELVKLRQQLQPHFLFNSLNSISALAGSQPQQARKMIQQLSDFLRGTLKKDGEETITLGEELEHLKLYLEIEKVRFGHRLNVEINADKNSLALYIPPLTLQPLVENAIKFGLYGTIEDITVSIESSLVQSALIVQIKNPFDEQTQTSGKGTGFGLSSVQRRLFLLYARNDMISSEKKDNIFTITLKIPQTK